MEVLTPMSSTIILSKPEGPKELFITLEIACVAKTVQYISTNAVGVVGPN